MDRAQLGATTPDQSGLESDDNEGVFCIPQSFSNSGISPSNCSVLYTGHSLVVVGGVLPLRREAVNVFSSPLLTGKICSSSSSSSNFLR